MSNPHEIDIDILLAGVHDWQSDEGLTDATSIAAVIEAHIEATLAIAYEQRTANLIAAHRIAWERGWNEAEQIESEIRDRLEVEEAK